MTRPLPEDPIIRQLVLQARRAQLSRRHMLQGTGVGAAALALAACAPSGSEAPTAATDLSESERTLVWANWPLYLDEDDDGNHPTLEAFQAETGISVDYRIDVDDNSSYYARVQGELALGRDIGADTVCLTEWMVSRFIRFGYAQELNHGNIPNIANLAPALADPDFDPGRRYSLPWQGGFAGIAWNTERVPGGLGAVSDLWDPALSGRVGVLSEMRDTIGLILLDQGVDIEGDWGDDEFGTALETFREHIGSGQIRNVRGNSYIEDLQSEDILAAICWSGDITALNYEVGYDKFEFIIPEAGGTIWNDSFLVPIGAEHKANAEALMNYYYEPEVAAEVAAWVNYVTPVVGAREAAVEIDPELADNQLIFPDEQTLSTVSAFRSLTPEEETEFSAEFQSVLLGA